MTQVRRRTITGFDYQGSVSLLWFGDCRPETVSSNDTIRSLEASFGGIEQAMGQEIICMADGCLMTSFVPVAEWTGPDIPDDRWVDYDSETGESPDYDPDCCACLRHQAHSLQEHEACLRRNFDASLP